MLARKEEPMTEAERYKRRIAGARARVAGQIFEDVIDASCTWYENQGILKATKTPEPMKPVSKPNTKGQFLACYTKKAQADFCGTMKGGRSVRFEAKQTYTDRFERSRLTPDQMKDLRGHHHIGALCFVLICFGFNNFYRVPWLVWDDMKAIYGRQYVTEEDLQKYKVKFEGGIIRFMDDIDADTSEEGAGL
jgi:recombination protein U